MSAEPAGPRPRIPSRRGRLILYLVLFVAVTVLGQMTGTALVPAAARAHIGRRFLEGTMAGATLPIWITSSLSGIVFTLLFWKLVDRKAIPRLGLQPNRAARHLLNGIAAGIGLMTLAGLPALAFGASSIRFLPDGGWAFARSFAAAALVFALGAVNEELICRGYILRNLLDGTSRRNALIVASIIFAAFHIINPHLAPLAFANLVLSGVLFILSVYRWGTLWFAFGLHFAWNLHQGAIMSQPVSGVRLPGLLDVPAAGPAWLTGGAFGPEGSLVTTLLLGAACLWIQRGSGGGLSVRDGATEGREVPPGARPSPPGDPG